MARIIRFTPHPVLAGFVNGIGLLLILSQLRHFITFDSGFAIRHPVQFAFVVGLVTVIVIVAKTVPKIPRALIGLGGGVAFYYAVGATFPLVPLGPVLGSLNMAFPPAIPLLNLFDPGSQSALLIAFPRISLTALALALIASFDTLMTLRVAQKLAARPVQPVRDLAAQGIGNCVAAMTGGLALTNSPSIVASAYRAGARTRLTSCVCAAILFSLTMFLPELLAGLPIGVISAIVVTSGFSAFDRWSIRQALNIFSKYPQGSRRRVLAELFVVAVVMGITASGAVIEGVMVGFSLSCLIFIVRMSRPIIARIYRGDEVTSRRIRPAADVAILRAMAERRAVFELEGVLFFGNADALTNSVGRISHETDVFIFDLTDIKDIDASGATSVDDLVRTKKREGKKIYFCNASAEIADTIEDILGRDEQAKALVRHDLDTALEYVEEQWLAADPERKVGRNSLPLARHDLLQGLSEKDIQILSNRLAFQKYTAGTPICIEGEAGDRMWLLTHGSVSIRLAVSDPRENQRIASRSEGTTVGEMALLGAGPRSALVTADDDVECYELDLETWEFLLAHHPYISSRILANLARILAERLRVTSNQLRLMRS